MAKRTIVPTEKIDRAILFLRNKRVMLDADLATVFGTTTKRLNQQVKRNLGRFPVDFLFQLTDEEKEWVVTNWDHLSQLKFSSANPFAFTEHGTIMLAAILNTPTAVEASVSVVRAFVKLREILLHNKDLANKLNDMEAKYDHQFRAVFEAMRKPAKDRIVTLPMNLYQRYGISQCSSRTTAAIVKRHKIVIYTGNSLHR